MNTNELNKYFVAFFMNSFFNNKLPSNSESYFITNDVIHSHNARSASNYILTIKEQIMGKVL